jgi:hypothetical protein
MRRIMAATAALMVPVLLATGPLLGAPKDKDLDKDLDKNTEQTIRAGVLIGKVAAVYEEKRKIRLEVSVPIPKLNTAALNAISQAQMQLRQAAARRDAAGMRAAQAQMSAQQAQLYTVEMKKQDVELEIIDDVVVRTARPREEFDEKGKPKKLTKKELKELKGPDPKLPGYKAEFGDVQVEQLLKVYLVRKKDAPKPVSRPKKKKDKDGDLGAELDLLADSQPKANMIVILLDPPPAK